MKVSAIAQRLGLALVGDPEAEIEGIAPLDRAGVSDLSFLANPKYREEAERSTAGALIVPEGAVFPGKTLLVSPNPYLSFARAVALFHPDRGFDPGIHPTAVVASDAVLSPGCHVGPLAVVGEGAEVGPGSVIEAGVVVGRDCVIGDDCHLYPRVVLYDRTILGDRVIVHSGAVLGSDGFGFAQEGDRHVKIPQVGRVVVEDDVEIGANTTVDRGALEETRIGRGTKIDNLVQVAHNVAVGPDCLLVAQSGISGSATLGRGVILAGQSGTVGHIRLGDHVRIGAKSAVTKDLPAHAFVVGHPARPHREWLKERALSARLQDLFSRIRKLERSRRDLPTQEDKP